MNCRGSVHTLDEKYSQERAKSVCDPSSAGPSQTVSTHPHYEPSPITNPGYLPNVVAVERFEGILEKMDKCCRQDNARSEVFPDEEHNAWYRNAGGVGGDVGKGHGCPIRTLTLPSMEGNSEGMVRRTKKRYGEYHCRRPSSLEGLRLSRCDAERRVHGRGWGQGGLGIGCRNNGIGSSPR